MLGLGLLWGFIQWGFRPLHHKTNRHDKDIRDELRRIRKLAEAEAKRR